MKLFSQRHGYKSLKDIIQVDSINGALRNGLWNILYTHYFRKDVYNPIGNIIFERLWLNYFKNSIDEIPPSWIVFYRDVRDYFFACTWYEAYDFIEFIANHGFHKGKDNGFINDCNKILKQEISAYRFVERKIVQITSEEEILSLEEALKSPVKPVVEHLNRAITLFGDRKSPDYRNSIKESISAVEALCRIIVKKNKASLVDALNKIENKVTLHPALKEAFKKLYGYTSDAEGIRHALLQESDLDAEDAKFMLVSCSGFINYLIVKIEKEGIEI